MPKREDIKRILVIGSGPIVIGQACEFDYSGAQACKVLKEDGYEVVLVNSNPATIMTDPGLADRTYVEPITPEFIERVIERERPDALLPTLGGQTGLNAAVDLARSGVLERYGVEMIGCDLAAIERGEDRKLFNEAMAELGLEVARSGYAYSVEDALAIVERTGYPCVLRPSFTMGGAGGGIAHDEAELIQIVTQGLELSPAGEVLVEESIEGWKEYEMEVMRDRAGNGIIVCSIENLDPMGVHTGDSITVAPAQTLSDLEYQRMRAASLAILEKIGVETGGSNVQFAVNPQNGRLIVIEMNPRVSRSSALASKATGFPIAKAAARLAVGYTLDEITNDITRATPACFEPSIDYCVVKVPRFAFEKFKGTDTTLTTRMKAVGEVMAIGRTFEESFGKAMRSLEDGACGFGVNAKGAGHSRRKVVLIQGCQLARALRVHAEAAGPVLERAHGLAERLFERAADRHDLAHGLHARGERRVGALELLKGEAGHLDHAVVELDTLADAVGARAQNHDLGLFTGTHLVGSHATARSGSRAHEVLVRLVVVFRGALELGGARIDRLHARHHAQPLAIRTDEALVAAGQQRDLGIARAVLLEQAH